MATNAIPTQPSASPWEVPPHNYALGDMGKGVADYLARGTDQIRELTRGREGSAVLMALAAGFGLGLVLGGIIGASQSRPRSWRDQITAEGLGQRVLQQIERLIPKTLAEQFPNR